MDINKFLYIYTYIESFNFEFFILFSFFWEESIEGGRGSRKEEEVGRITEKGGRVLEKRWT